MAIDTLEPLVEEIASEKEDKDTGVAIYRIASYPADPTLQVIYDKWNRGEIEVPKFQRGWVWTQVQASRLIESFLLGLPVPSIFMFKTPSQIQLVIDGQQRLRSICSFFDGQLPDGKPFFLKGVNPKWEGKCFEDLAGEDQIRLRDAVLRVMTVEQLDPKDETSIYHIFERLNTGGTPLTPQEVRNCVFQGPLTDFLTDLNSNDTWREVFGAKQSDPRMRDLELIVRFFALDMDLDSYTKPMKEFMNHFMARHWRDSEKEPYQTKFLGTVTRVVDNLGARPFHIKRGINAAVFDSVMVAFSRSNSVPRNIKTRFQRLLKNPSFIEATTNWTTDVATVKRRMALAQEILFS